MGLYCSRHPSREDFQSFCLTFLFSRETERGPPPPESFISCKKKTDRRQVDCVWVSRTTQGVSIRRGRGHLCCTVSFVFLQPATVFTASSPITSLDYHWKKPLFGRLSRLLPPLILQHDAKATRCSRKSRAQFLSLSSHSVPLSPL